MSWHKNPVVYEINAKLWLNELTAQSLDKKPPVTLSNVPQEKMDQLRDLGFDAVWLMGAWERSPAGRELDQHNQGLITECKQSLDDFKLEDIVGSPYAIRCYRIDPVFGGEEGLAIFRDELRARGMKLVLDFVANHLAIDNCWVQESPDLFLQGCPADLENGNNFFSVEEAGRQLIFAHGRDPGFAGWPDTVQLDYRLRKTREFMIGTLLDIAGICDGLRCDMAMLTREDIFLRTWGYGFASTVREFWDEAIQKLKQRYPDFVMMAEVYWFQEDGKLQNFGFDYTYDKWLYDVLRDNRVDDLRQHLRTDLQYQLRTVRFLENHDETPAAQVFGQRGKMAATLALTLPGMRLVQDGQLEGRCWKVPIQAGRRKHEEPDADLTQFYVQLLNALSDPVFHDGQWQLLEPQEVHGDGTYRNLMVYQWLLGKERRLVAVNLSALDACCSIRVNMPELAGRDLCNLQDLLDTESHPPDKSQLLNSSGIFLALPGYGYKMFKLEVLLPTGFEYRDSIRQDEGITDRARHG